MFTGFHLLKETAIPAKRDGWPVLLLCLLSFAGFVSFQEVIQLSQERLALDAVYHAGFLYGLTPGRGAAQAMHTDGKEQGSSLRGNIQNITDDGIFFNLNSHNRTSLCVSSPIITIRKEKNKREFSSTVLE
jgi:hypothetical protein